VEEREVGREGERTSGETQAERQTHHGCLEVLTEPERVQEPRLRAGLLAEDLGAVREAVHRAQGGRRGRGHTGRVGVNQAGAGDGGRARLHRPRHRGTHQGLQGGRHAEERVLHARHRHQTHRRLAQVQQRPIRQASPARDVFQATPNRHAAHQSSQGVRTRVQRLELDGPRRDLRNHQDQRRTQGRYH